MNVQKIKTYTSLYTYKMEKSIERGRHRTVAGLRDKGGLIIMRLRLKLDTQTPFEYPLLNRKINLSPNMHLC